VHIGATWRIRLNRFCVPAMRPYINVLNHLLLYSTISTTMLPRVGYLAQSSLPSQQFPYILLQSSTPNRAAPLPLRLPGARASTWLYTRQTAAGVEHPNFDGSSSPLQTTQDVDAVPATADARATATIFVVFYETRRQPAASVLALSDTQR